VVTGAELLTPRDRTRLGLDSAVDEVEVGRVVGAVLGNLPASSDRVPVVA
jgi:hypothetical protein